MRFFTPFIVIKILAICALGIWMCNAQSSSVSVTAVVQPSPSASGDAQPSAISISASVSGLGNIDNNTVIAPSATASVTLSASLNASSNSSSGQNSGQNPSGTTSTPPQGPTAPFLSQAEQEFNRKLETAYSKLDTVFPVPMDPLEATEKDRDILFKIDSFFTTAETLQQDYASTVNKTLDVVKINASSAIQMTHFDCLDVRGNVFPSVFNPSHANSYLGTSSIKQVFDCPWIIKNDSLPSAGRRRRRRDVELTMEFEWSHEEDDIPEDHANMWHYLRTRREAQTQDNNSSCGVLPCNVSRIQVRLKITNRNYTAKLSDENSAEYKELNGIIQNAFSDVATNLSSPNATWSFAYLKTVFSAGSVVANAYVDLATAFKDVVITNFTNSFTSMSEYSGLFFDISYVAARAVVPQNGGWAAWGSWGTDCNSNFEKKRRRTCSDPLVMYGGADCQGPKEESMKCECEPLRTDGNITSPFYPNQYPTNVMCTWVITVPVNHTIELELADFQLEKDKDCHYDYVQVLDGNGTGAPELLPRTCGMQGHRKLLSTGEMVTLIFHSDFSEIYKGFRVVWKKIQKVWPVPKPIEYIPQSVTVTNILSCPSFNHTAVPSGQGTTCPTYSPEAGCIFDKPVYMISCFIGMKMSRNLSLTGGNTIKLAFQHTMHKSLFPKYYLGDKYCVTWNKTARGRLDGGWTRRGCSVAKTNLTHTECECDHTGMFAVVASEKMVYRKLKLLSNTYIGIGVSLAILLLAMVHIVWKIHIHGGEVMRLSICAAMIYMECMFVIGANVKAEQTLCGFLAFSIYFSVLAEFCWLMLHALRLHGKIKELFASGLNIDAVYVCVGWGLPLLLALIAIGIQIDLKNPEDVCWTAVAGGAMWGYSAPLLIIVMCNVAVLITLLIPTKKRLEEYDYHEMRYRVVKDAILLLFFGITCLTAYQAVALETFRAQYYLTVSLILQSVAMFVFGREGRKDFVKKLEENKAEGENESQQTNEEDLPEKGQEGTAADPAQEEKEKPDEKGKAKKRKRQAPEKLKVPTLKNLNIYKEDGQYVIEA